MKLFGILTLSGLAAALEHHASLLGGDAADIQRIPTSYESAVMGRRILALTKLATLSTVFPASSSSSSSSSSGAGHLERRPESLDGVPIGMPEYTADCEGEGNPTLLALKIATSFRNVRDGSNITLSMQWVPPYPPSKRISLLSRLSSFVPFMRHSPYNESPEPETPASGPDTAPYSAANLPRFSLIGYLEPINPDLQEAARLAECYTLKHRDAKYWLPGNHIHTSEWARLVVTNVYWVGGFGDRAYIGWIPVEEWNKVTEAEWKSIQLQGEKKGWSEWTVDQGAEL